MCFSRQINNRDNISVVRATHLYDCVPSDIETDPVQLPLPPINHQMSDQANVSLYYVLTGIDGL